MMSGGGFLLGVILGGTGMILGARCMRKRARKKEIRGYLDLIDLTADQREKVEEIRRTFLPRVAGIRQELRNRRMELSDLLFESPLDRNKINAVVKEVSRLQLALEQEVIEHIIEENGLLTPDQQREFYKVIIKQFSSGGLGVHDVRKT
ncbi:MAG: Spy/CpxP family protein refolding chaperone [Pseudomonadota bacterium]